MIELVSGQEAALQGLEKAFRACPHDFTKLKQEVAAGRVSLYELSGERYRVTIAGEVVGHSYYLWAASGRGVIPALRELKQYVKDAGLSSISAETYFPLVAKLGRRLGTTEKACGETTHMEIKV